MGFENPSRSERIKDWMIPTEEEISKNRIFLFKSAEEAEDRLPYNDGEVIEVTVWGDEQRWIVFKNVSGVYDEIDGKERVYLCEGDGPGLVARSIGNYREQAP